VETLGLSPFNSEEHWIMGLTMSRSKTEFDVSGSGYVPWIRIAVYDADNGTQGVQAWPPTGRDVPNDWGQETGTMEQIPESLSIVAVVLLSSFAVAGFYLLRKAPKPEKYGALKGPI